MELLIDHGIDSNAQANNNLTPMHLCAQENKVDVAALLLSHNAKIDANTNAGYTPLSTASYFGKTDMVCFLVQNKAAVNSITKKGQTPLHLAAKNGHGKIVEVLLLNGAFPNALDNASKLALDYAKEANDIDSINLLTVITQDKDEISLELPTERIEESESSKGPSAENVSTNNEEPTIFKLVDKLQQRSDKWTPLQAATKYNKPDVVKILLERGSDPNEVANGLTPLLVASHYNHAEMSRILIQNGSKVDMGTLKSEHAPLHIAALKNHSQVATVLLNAGADINQQCKFGTRPLHQAAKAGHPDMIKLLVKSGGDINATALNGSSPIHMCENNLATLGCVIDEGANIDVQTKSGYTPLHSYCYWGNVDAVKMLLSNGAALNKQTKRGSTALHLATLHGYADIVKLLIAHKANPDVKDNNQKSALDLAISNDQQVVIPVLKDVTDVSVTSHQPADKKADEAVDEQEVATEILDISEEVAPLDKPVDEHEQKMLLAINKLKQNKDNYTPMQIAAKYNRVDIAKFLLDRGTDANEGNKQMSPLFVACHYNNLEMVKLLLEHQASLNQATAQGLTPIHCAVKKDHLQLAEQLLSQVG